MNEIILIYLHIQQAKLAFFTTGKTQGSPSSVL